MIEGSLRVFVGWDSREDIAWQICRSSMIRQSSRPLTVRPLRQSRLRAAGLYARPVDPLASTEFTYSRFLVPYLAGYEGWALFCDCDFLWLGDVAALFAMADPRYALMCVHHDHRPPETMKMDGCVQTVYPRKNWSSLMLMNCGHPANRALTPEIANTQSGAFLHRFQWLDDEQIGAVPESFNWLEGWCLPPASGKPAAVHYTRGGPWFANWQDVHYAREWLDEAAQFEMEGGTPPWNVLDFWFEEVSPDKWWETDPALDNLIRDRFLDLYDAAAAGKLANWRATPHGALAEIILLDQFSRNLFREGARSFACDAQALSLAKAAMARGDDTKLDRDERRFLYLPFMHSELAEDQDTSVRLFGMLGDGHALDHAERHREIIRRFGRFPNRNAALGRAARADEAAFLTQNGRGW